ncbi:tetratricopeptide repeat protein [Microvirga tunisiensis]|uniref:Tetratricopeptide repeat protein n=1 Tax=Pannonibacter tanglangensis TaxID=2750084 RepID=A0A7X5J7F5_9HYPH|nr:tetratricopeptide repeat protein [Pannonibacter sp. XCT-53]NBN77699.1 tetratricopeptide repeat protein [Pannonibacter sp. XCT-53]
MAEPFAPGSALQPTPPLSGPAFVATFAPTPARATDQPAGAVAPQAAPAAAADPHLAQGAAGRGDSLAPVPSLENARRSQEEVEDAFRQATGLLRDGQLDEAAAQLRRILFAHPDHLRARANLGNCQFLLGDLANAEQSFEAVLADAPDNRNALYGLATIRLQQGDAGRAQELATRLAALTPDSAPALTLLADATADDPRPGTAIAAYRAALRQDETYLPALVGLSRLMLKRSRVDEALDLADRAARLGQGSSEAFTCLGDALMAAGNLMAAREAYEAALKRTRSGGAIAVRLSVLARKSGDHRAALRHADDAWSDRPDDREAGNAVGAALAALGERLAAREVLTAMVHGRPVQDWVRDIIERHRTVPMPDMVWSPHAPAAPDPREDTTQGLDPGLDAGEGPATDNEAPEADPAASIQDATAADGSGDTPSLAPADVWPDQETSAAPSAPDDEAPELPGSPLR